MAINPITYTEKVVRSFLKYQLSAYPFTDERLHEQMRELLNMDKVRRTPLLNGPYVSLSRSFLEGASVASLIEEGVLHPHLRQIIPSRITHVYGHQEEAIRAIRRGKTTLVSTGTGSGKTEAFLYPIISKALELKDAGAESGISAVIVYPMNALAEDQLDRLRGLLAGSGITFGMYVGKTPPYERDVAGTRLPPGSSRADYEAVLKRYRDEGRPDSIHPAEELCSRERMRTRGSQPRVLLTNVKQLELLLTRGIDVELFDGARLDYLVFDEAHTFTGAQGAETACLIRRLRSFCGQGTAKTVCVATSATIADRKDPEAARAFASRFFGVAAENIACVHEKYEREVWSPQRTLPPEPPGDRGELLKDALEAVDAADADARIPSVYRRLTGETLGDGPWQGTLYEALSHNELAYQIQISLNHPRVLDSLCSELKTTTGRPVCEEELVTYLALGATAVLEGRPIFRPVVHGFIRGIPGAVVTFPQGDEVKLWLSAEDDANAFEGKSQLWRVPVLTCTTCGQHYFETWLKDFRFTGNEPEGGQIAEEGGVYWETLARENDGSRAVLLDRAVFHESDEDAEGENRLHPLYFCRRCGTAHVDNQGRCLHCGAMSPLVKLYAVRNNEKNPGYVSSCIACGARGRSLGRRYREPMRPVRAVNVSDVHVLAQDMIHHAERKRLLLFADNRQDAAFQAGWMKDHSRRFRLRSLMAETMQERPVSVSDMVLRLDDMLDADDTLSRVLIPEVWRVVPKEGTGGSHQEERRYFLRIQVLRELTMAANQQLGLEPWGRIKVEYVGLEAGSPFIQQWARKLKLPPDDLKGGISALLDQLRRQRLLHDPLRGIFGRWWQDGDKEIQRGYLPDAQYGPKGMKLALEPGDKKEYIQRWSGPRETVVRQIVGKWGVSKEDEPKFLEELWDDLRSESVAVLVPVTLKSSKEKPLANCSGVYQIDAGRLLLSENHGYYRCRRCRRKVSRRTPFNKCMAWRCDGTLEFVGEDLENYNLQLLDDRYSMVRPEEHTAMVPQDQREKIENWFKGDGERVNTLVCTPTLELGVDIGAIDSVLLRNVPPLPANYWQRAGRAGRRHRMAVNVTYCRPISHDRAYYVEPVKMLAGKVDPPAFNLQNEQMIAKHTHAACITRLFQLTRESSGLPEVTRARIRQTLDQMFPRTVTGYLFESSGTIRLGTFDVGPLAALIQEFEADLFTHAKGVFSQGWSQTDAEVVADEALTGHIRRMSEALAAVLERLRKRLHWAHREIQRLNEKRVQAATLESEDDTHFKRCDRLIKKLKGMQTRKRREAEGYDDINTYGVLAAEGFLPGYGLDTGSVIGMAEVPPWQFNSVDFDLPRPTSVALREYVPGNLIYANGHKFVARRFHRDIDEERHEMPCFDVNVEREAVSESAAGAASASLGGDTLQAISVCDVDLVHQSQILDEEETRFQMPVTIYGIERSRHNGGMSYSWGTRTVSLRKGVHLRLVNVGATTAIDRQQLGYPICTICGQSVSPLSSQRQIDDFFAKHEEWCGRRPEHVGLYADVVADCLTIQECKGRTEAYSVLESLRMGATRVLDMHLEDLQIVVIGHVDRDEVDAILWDPMPGGSGLLNLICDRFKEIVAIAQSIAAECPSGCDHSCIDCLQNFRNGHYHKHLDRHAFLDGVAEWGDSLVPQHEIPPRQPKGQAAPTDQPTNDAEMRLKHLLTRAGFTDGEFQHGIRFGEKITPSHQIGSTTPDVYFAGDPDDPDDRGTCIYLDGLSDRLHGDPRTAEKDAEIRSWLRNNGFQVLEISAVDLTDRGAMIRHFKRLARFLSGKEMANRIGEETGWFEE